MAKNITSARACPRAPDPGTIPFPKPGPAPKVDYPFLMVPDMVARDRGLSAGAKILFGVIFSSARRGHCYASNASLAERCGLSVIQVRRLLKVLEDRELIARDLKGKSRDEIRVPWSCIRKMHGGDQNDAGGCIKTMQDDVSKGCTELEKRVENSGDEDFPAFGPGTEWFGEMKRHFGWSIPQDSEVPS